jgi:hypothetical protein
MKVRIVVDVEAKDAAELRHVLVDFECVLEHGRNVDAYEKPVVKSIAFVDRESVQ